MKVDVSNLNIAFNIQGDDYMEMSEGYEVFSGGESFHTEESISHYKELRKGWKPNLGKKQSEEWKLNHANSNAYQWSITYKDGSTEVIKNKNKWMRDNSYERGSINRVKNGKLRSYKGIVNIEKIG